MMTWHWKELLPVDHFSVRTSQYITEIDRLTLTLLYQPLIGAIAHSLYVTLLSQLEQDEYWSKEQTHRQLMLLIGVPLETIYEERKKLEAIGLMRTYKQKEDDETSYLYELIPPLSPQQFFENDVLSVYLFNRLGKNQYRQLRERFMLQKVEREDYIELTHAFDEVFTSLKHSEMIQSLHSETGHALQVPKDEQIVAKGNSEDLYFKNEHFDFDLLEKSLSKSILTSGGLSTDAKKIIGLLAFVYRVEPLEMSSLVSQVLVHDDELNPVELRKRVQEWYKFEHGMNPPALGLRTQPEQHRTTVNQEPQTEEERTIQFYETTPPLSLLEIRSVGAQVALADVKMVEALMIDFKLLPGVVNVLLDFILYNHDMKLPKALTEKIAGHWSRKKIKTVKEAMDLALTEQEQTAVLAEKKQTKKGAPRKNTRRDKLPKWLIAEREKENSDKQKEVQPPKQETPSSEDEKSVDQMLEELRRLQVERGETP